MAVSADIEVYGIRDALRELGKIDSKYKFKVINRVKAAGKPMLDKARENYPTDPVLTDSNGNVTWRTTGRLGYSKKMADRGVVMQVGGRAFGNAYAIVTIVQKNPGAAMFDIAGFANGSWSKGPKGDAFIAKLNREYGQAQRGMWRNIVQIRELAGKSMTKALNEVMAEVNRNLVITKKAA